MSSCHSSEHPCNCSCSIPCRDASPPRLNNRCSFCKDCTVEWADCSMHNPAAGSLTAKDFDALCKSAHTKSRDPQSTSCCPTSPPRHERESHSLYHADNHHHSKHSCSRSRSCSCSPPHSPSCDHYNNDCCSSQSSHPRHDNYVGHHDFPTNPPA